MIAGYLAKFVLQRHLQFKDDPFDEFLKLGAQCWGPRAAPGNVWIELQEEDSFAKSDRMAREEARRVKHLAQKAKDALKRKEKRALFLA